MTVKTFWNREKKLPANLDGIKVDFGMTSNANVNAVLALRHIYYDFYNNGGYNIDDEDDFQYLTELLQYVKDAGINTVGKISLSSASLVFKKLSKEVDDQYVALENFMDTAFDLLKNRNFDFEIFTVYQNYDNRLLSMEKHDNDQWSSVTFGKKQDLDAWVDARQNNRGFNFKMI